MDNVDVAALLGLQRYEILRPLVRDWLRTNVASAGPVADRVVEQLVLKGPTAIGVDETLRCLAVIPEVARIFSRTQAESVAEVAAGLAAAPTNPYRPVMTSAPSRVALADLLAVRPELDDFVIPPESVSTDPSVRSSLKSLAIALGRDEAHRPSRFLAACKRARLNRNEIVHLAGHASASRVRGSRLEDWAPLPATRRWLRHTTATVFAWIAPVAFATGLLLGFVAYPPPNLFDRVTLGVTLAAFALIATVHALIITLSREHLPRRMARIAATPRILVSAYVTAIIGLVASAFELSDNPVLTKAELSSWEAALNGLALVAVLVSVGLLAVSSFQVLRLSDPVSATEVFGRSNALKLGRAGSRFGRAQARSLELTSLLGALPNVLVAPDAIPGEVTQLVRAESRGLFLPSRRPLRQLVTSSQFESGMSLRVLAPLGLVVARLDPVLALIPTASQQVSRDTRRRATAVAALVGIKWLDRSRGVTASLYDLAVRTCREGDQGGAQRAASVCLDLCFRHLSNMTTARGRAYARGRARADRRTQDVEWRPGMATWRPNDPNFSSESPPPSPVVDDIIAACARSLSSDINAERDVAQYVLKGLLAFGTREDRIPTAISCALLTEAKGVTGEQVRLQMLRRCALRSLELDLRDEFFFVVGTISFPRIGNPENVVDEIAATLAAAARIDAETAEASLAGYLADERLGKDTRYRGLFQVGAAALESGALKLAVKCVEELCRPGFVAPTQHWLEMEGRLAKSGSFLGNSPRDALAQFSDWAVGIEPSLRTP